ncbi:MAG: hypothetical protein ACRCTE_12740 [Cellulosilyticaceae bacterium]
MPLYFFLCLLKNKELRNDLITVETADCTYMGYLRGVNEQSLEMETTKEDGCIRVYVVLSKIMSVTLSKMCCELKGKDDIKCFSEIGLEKQTYYEHHPKYERYLTYQLMKRIKEQEKANQWMEIVLTNSKKVYFKVENIQKVLEEITVFYNQITIAGEKQEWVCAINNEFINAIQLIEEQQK